MANDSVNETFARLVEYIAKKFLRGEVTLAELVELDDKEIDIIFMLGHYLYNYGKYQQALSIFGTLTFYRPFVSKYWRAAGAANQALKRFEEAITAYDMALTSDMSDTVSLTYRGECKLSLGLNEDGLRDLKEALNIGSRQFQHQQWVQRAKTLLAVRGIK